MQHSSGNGTDEIRVAQIARKTFTDLEGEVTDTFWLLCPDGFAYEFVEGETDVRIHLGRNES